MTVYFLIGDAQHASENMLMHAKTSQMLVKSTIKLHLRISTLVFYAYKWKHLLSFSRFKPFSFKSMSKSVLIWTNNSYICLFVFITLVCRNNAFYVCVGIGVGTIGGFMLGLYVARPYAPPVMKSIACLYIRGPDVRNTFSFYNYNLSFTAKFRCISSVCQFMPYVHTDLPQSKWHSGACSCRLD